MGGSAEETTVEGEGAGTLGGDFFGGYGSFVVFGGGGCGEVIGGCVGDDWRRRAYSADEVGCEECACCFCGHHG